VTQILGHILNNTLYRGADCSDNTTCESHFLNIESIQYLKNEYFTTQIVTAIITVVVLYILYYRKFRHYAYIDKRKPVGNQKNIGQPVSVFPNGWYAACRFNEIKNGEAKSIDIAG
jgi:hypothetical protein